MAGRGPAPKEPDKRERRNADVAVTELDAESAVEAPELPGAAGFRDETRAWYAVWASSPQAAQFLGTDWQRLHMLAHLVDAYFKSPSKEALGEIRLNEAKLGGTPEDRLRLRWRMADNAGAEERAARQGAARPTARRRTDPRLKLVEGAA
jgi:hypothetical protein